MTEVVHLILDTACDIFLIEYICCCVQLEKVMLVMEEYILWSEGNCNFLLTGLLYDTGHRVSSTSARDFLRKEQEWEKSRKSAH